MGWRCRRAFWGALAETARAQGCAAAHQRTLQGCVQVLCSTLAGIGRPWLADASTLWSLLSTPQWGSIAATGQFWYVQSMRLTGDCNPASAETACTCCNQGLILPHAIASPPSTTALAMKVVYAQPQSCAVTSAPHLHPPAPGPWGRPGQSSSHSAGCQHCGQHQPAAGRFGVSGYNLGFKGSTHLRPSDWKGANTLEVNFRATAAGASLKSEGPSHCSSAS